MNNEKSGIINGIIAFVMWGVYPLYWAMLQTISPQELLINRMFWSFFTLIIFILVFKKMDLLKETLKSLVLNKKKILLLVCAALFLAANWFVFTFSIVEGRVLEASLGYYINPLLNVLIGVVFLKEKLNKFQILAVLIALMGVLYLTISYGVLPWISLVLAFTFALYSLIKKFIAMDSFISLFLETTLMLPISVFFFSSWLANGQSAFLNSDLKINSLLIGAGLITVLPLFFFAKAASLLQLKTLGFLQYIGPSLQMLMAIFVLGESFSKNRLISFVFIWIACLIFSMSHRLVKKIGLVSP